MIDNIRHSFLKFITQDVQDESETKELAVLLRLLNCLFALYFAVLSFIVAYFDHYTLSLVLIFGIGILAGSFICTYENRTQSGLTLFNLAVILSTSYLTLAVGFNKNYHWLICVTIFLSFFNLHKTQKYKITYAAAITAYTIMITCFSRAYPVLKELPDFFISTIIIMNLIVFCTSVTLIAYFFSAKFMKSEEKILLYTKKLINMASVDALTGLFNRRHMNDHMKEMAYNCSKTNKTFCIAIGDVDLFKNVNDTYGHDTGDYVLITLSGLFQDFMAERGKAARWGGEEFLFVFDSGNLNICYADLEQLRKKINHFEFDFKDHKFRISMTFGIEEYNEHSGIETTISHADSKLYIGKKEGRNRVIR